MIKENLSMAMERQERLRQEEMRLIPNQENRVSVRIKTRQNYFKIMQILKVFVAKMGQQYVISTFINAFEFLLFPRDGDSLVSLPAKKQSDLGHGSACVDTAHGRLIQENCKLEPSLSNAAT